MQMICALLIFGKPELPAPLCKLSPWLDWLITPREQVFARLAAQQHRRFIKTHTPLDGLPLDPRVTYIVVGRHPLDMAVSLYHQSNNINRERVRELTGLCGPEDVRKPRPALHDWLVSWIESQERPAEQLDSLPGVMWHLSDAWARRTRSALLQPHVVLVHYDDLSSDLDGEMRRLAGVLGIAIRRPVWAELVRAATFEQMRARAATKAPDPAGILKDPAAFFRRGCSGAGHEELQPPELARYYSRAARLAAPGLFDWLHRESLPGQELDSQGARERDKTAGAGRVESAVTG
jgi:hypothetical protein